MNILVIGSGGREHAIINSISKSIKCSKIFALPGNGGTELLAENLSGDVNDFELIKKISLKNKISPHRKICYRSVMVTVIVQHLSCHCYKLVTKS